MSLLRAFTGVLVFAMLGSRFDRPHAVLDNLSNFPLHFATAFLACTTIFAVMHDTRWMIASVACMAVSLTPVVSWSLAASKGGNETPATPVRLLFSNVYLRNRQHARLASLIKAERPDVVALVEVDSSWLQGLKSLRSDYPYQFEEPDEKYAGLALYSKLPLANPRVLRVNETATPTITATLRLPTGEVDFYLTHPLPPIGAAFIRSRNDQLRDLGHYIRTMKRPAVLAGDLNVTMWNRGFRSFAEETGLRSARGAHRIGPTWPAMRAIGVPIDHILATAPVQFGRFEVLTGIGSDHFPISAEFGLPAALGGVARDKPGVT